MFILNFHFLIALHGDGVCLVGGRMQEVQTLSVVSCRSLNFEVGVKQKDIPNRELFVVH